MNWCFMCIGPTINYDNEIFVSYELEYEDGIKS